MSKYTERRLQYLAGKLWDREKPVCQSHLVDMLMGEESVGEAFSYDAVENMYPDPGNWSRDQCNDWFAENGYDLLPPDTDLDEYRDWIGCNADPAEIYEWWCVSDWFADKLRAQGECILANDYGTWWGRQCSGQSVVLDPCIQRIAVDVLGWTLEGEG